MRPVVVGTAGHIDHGKSTLVRALTGVDPDRLAEEKRRGITIDLGFASAEVDGRVLSFVDVPGHERLIRNMVAGATGMDLVLLVVAADESVMPQTREHLAIARLLGVRSGVVALTKIDLAEEEMAEVAAAEVEELVAGTFLEGAAVVRVAADRGEGLDELRAALVKAAEGVPEPRSDLIPRLPIDRAFAMRGFGTVVTGTLSGGTLRAGDEVEVVPEGPVARIRGLEVHGRSAEEAPPGCRVAVNLGGVSKDELTRGQVLAPAGALRPAAILDAVVEVLPDAPAPLHDLMRVRVHLGTAEVMARLRPLGATVLERGRSGPVQLRLERPVAVQPGDHLILRRYSPLATLGGGRVADLDPPKARRADGKAAARISGLADASPRDRALRLAEEAAEAGWEGGAASSRLGLLPAGAAALTGELVGEGLLVPVGERFLATPSREALASRLLERVREFHARQPLDEGILREVLRSACAPRLPADAFRGLLRGLEEEGRLRLRGDAVALPDHGPELTAEQEAYCRHVETLLLDAGLDPPSEETLLEGSPRGEGVRLLRLLEKEGTLVKLGDGRYFHAAPLETLREQLRSRARQGEKILDVATFKRLAGVTRKSAIPILERFDAERLTVRRGDQRVILADS